MGGVVGAGPLTLQMLLSNDKSAWERLPSEPRASARWADQDLAGLCGHAACVQLRLNVDIMQLLEFQYLCFPVSDLCLWARAAQPLPETAAVTITSAAIMKIEENEMLARRQTVSSVIPQAEGGGAALNANICVASVHTETLTQTRVERTSAVRKHGIDQRLVVCSLSAGLCGFSAGLSAGCGFLMVADVDSSRR